MKTSKARSTISVCDEVMRCGRLIGTRLNWYHRIMESEVVHSDPGILGGVPVFVGTRVPVRILWEHLEAGDSLEDFLEGFPSVKRDQAVRVIQRIRENLPSAIGEIAS